MERNAVDALVMQKTYYSNIKKYGWYKQTWPVTEMDLYSLMSIMLYRGELFSLLNSRKGCE